MPYLYEYPIINIGVYYDKECMADDPSIHPFDNGIAEYTASTIRDHFCTAEKTAAMFGRRRNMKMCVQVKVPYDKEKFKADPSEPWRYGGYYEVLLVRSNYNDCTDLPEAAVSLIGNGFCKEVIKELPMEFAVESQKLLGVTLEGSVG